jgi:GLPGLI family protein
MHKKILVLFSLFFFSIVGSFAQSSDLVSTSYTYHVTYLGNAGSSVDDICQLDITKSQSYFYSLGEIERRKKMVEAFAKADQTGAQPILSAKSLKKNFCRFSIIKNYRTKQAIISERVDVQQLAMIKDTLSNKGWVISKEKKIINNLPCTMAQIKKGSVTTTAWFTTQIATQEGPFYYYGLPGLIVNLKNSLGWEAELVKTSSNTNQNSVIKIPRYTLISEKQMEKAKKNAKAMVDQGVFSNGDRIEKAKN